MRQNYIVCDEGKVGYNTSDVEIEFKLILLILARNKFLIILVCLACAVSAFLTSLAFPNRYKATAILAPAQKDSGGQLGSLASQYGGLAAIAGISLGKESDKTEQAVTLLKSWPFLDAFISKYNLSADVLAIKEYDKISKRLVYDESIYDDKNKSWVRSRFEEAGGVPSSWVLYKKINSMVEVQTDKKTGLVSVSVTHVSPAIAKTWVELLTKELNLHFQVKDKEEARRNIDYLERKISETSISEMQSVFFGMVEAQTKLLMLTERSDDYLFKILVNPMLPEEKASPKRLMISIVGCFLGFLVGVFFVMIRFFFSENG